MTAESKHTPGAIRAAEAIVQYQRSLRATLQASELAEIIDRETGAPELLEALETILSEVWDGETLGVKDALSCSIIRDKARAAIAKAKPED